MSYFHVEAIPDDRIAAYVAYADAALNAQMQAALRCIESVPDLRLFGLTGPTCSGKTTAADMMTNVLESRGYEVHIISLDNFYYDKEYLHRRSDEADIALDYDSEETIDTALFADCAEKLFCGETVQLPRFDFGSGTREIGEILTPQKKDIFLFEGIQVLYPKIRAILAAHQNYRSIAIHPQSGIIAEGETFEPNEIRLYRRLVRDHRHRATDPNFTLSLWASVRANEEKNIFPYLHLCHTEIDSTMPYELGMLKPYLVPLMQSIPETSENRAEADRILFKLTNIKEISSEYIAPNTLYKEFI